MRKVRITAIRKTCYPDLMEKYENPIEHACDVEEGMTWISENGQRPEGFCDSAWESMAFFVKTLAQGGGNFYDGWMKDPYSAMISCNDGFRPVSFYLEALDGNAKFCDHSARNCGGSMIRKAEIKEAHILAELACRLWPDNVVQEMQKEMETMITQRSAALFLAYDEETAIGFAQCQLRHDYVEGTESTPVGYLEGIYVADGYRKQGVARKLLAACENWAKAQGCSEFASDCELTNAQSLQFHLNVGFAEANRIICFKKKLS